VENKKNVIFKGKIGNVFKVVEETKMLVWSWIKVWKRELNFVILV
jgi:hypothetical protein